MKKVDVRKLVIEWETEYTGALCGEGVVLPFEIRIVNGTPKVRLDANLGWLKANGVNGIDAGTRVMSEYESREREKDIEQG